MNFLSHYYFNRYEHNPSLTFGQLFPDLLKNADKQAQVFPEKHELALSLYPELDFIRAGWAMHIKIDKIFHNLPFFHHHTHALRLKLAPVVENTPIRAFFLAHIGLELLLDHLILVDEKVNEKQLYAELAAVPQSHMILFLEECQYAEIQKFLNFFEQFQQHRYLGMYRNLSQVTQGLLNICRRIWKITITDELREQLTEQLAAYLKILRPVYKSVFEEIEAQL